MFPIIILLLSAIVVDSCCEFAAESARSATMRSDADGVSEDTSPLMGVLVGGGYGFSPS
jgi:hypothetical protein